MPIPAIVQRIVLEGIEAIEAKLRAMGATGEKAFKQIQAAGNATADGGRRAEEQLKNIGVHTLEHASGANKIREGLHVLHPLLRATGIELGGLRAYSALAGAGMGAFAGVITGVVLVALERLQEKTEEAKARLDALGGAGAFDKLSPLARELGTSPAELAPAAGAAAQAREAGAVNPALYGYARPTDEQQQQTLGTIIKGARGLDKLSEEDATKVATEFFQNITKAGGLMNAEVFKALSDKAPAFADALARQFLTPSQIGAAARLGIHPSTYLEEGFLKQPGVQGFTLQQAEQGVARAAPEADKAFANSVPKLKDGVGHVIDALESLSEHVGRIGLAQYLDDLAANIRKFSDNLDNSPLVQGAAGTAPPQGPLTANKSIGYGLGEGLRYSPLGAAIGAGIGGVGGSFLFPGAGTLGGAWAGAEIGAAIPPLIGGAYEGLRRLGGYGPGAASPSAVAPTISPESWQLPQGRSPWEITALPGLAAMQWIFGPGRPTPATSEPGGFTQQLGAPAPMTPAADLRTIDNSTNQTAENTAETNRILGAIDAKIDKTPSSTGGGSGFAAGGTIRGPGTGTSDSIVMPLEVGGFVLRERVNRALSGYADGGKVLARVSAGERYFTRAEVQGIGLDRLQKLNAMSGGGPIRLPRFDDGGDVDADSKTSTISLDEERRLLEGPQVVDTTAAFQVPPGWGATAFPGTAPPPRPPSSWAERMGVAVPIPASAHPSGLPGVDTDPRWFEHGVGGVDAITAYKMRQEEAQSQQERIAAMQSMGKQAEMEEAIRRAQGREDQQRNKAFGKFQKSWQSWRSKEHNAGDIAAAHARLWGTDTGIEDMDIHPGAALRGFVPLFPKHPRPEHHSSFSVSVGGLARGGVIVPSVKGVPNFSLGGMVLPRFDVGGPVTTSAPPPSIPSMGDEGVDFSSLGSSRGVPMAPRLDPSASGATHVIDWRINGEPVAHGRGDDALVDSLQRISVRDQSRRAGKAASWVGS